jgi:hypothetical protein
LWINAKQIRDRKLGFNRLLETREVEVLRVEKLADLGFVPRCTETPKVPDARPHYARVSFLRPRRATTDLVHAPLLVDLGVTVGNSSREEFPETVAAVAIDAAPSASTTAEGTSAAARAASCSCRKAASASAAWAFSLAQMSERVFEIDPLSRVKRGPNRVPPQGANPIEKAKR